MNFSEWSWNRKILILLLALLLPLAVVLMLSLRGFVREVIVLPLSYVLWLGDLLIDSTPQGLFWALVVILGLFIAGRSLYVAGTPRDKIPDVDTRSVRRQRVGFWLLQVRLAREGVSRVRFADFLSKLATEVLAFREHVTPLEIEQRLQYGDLVTPPEIGAFMRLRRMESGERLGLLARLKKLLSEWRSLLAGEYDGRRPDASGDDLERAIHYLEDELEIKHDI